MYDINKLKTKYQTSDLNKIYLFMRRKMMKDKLS